MSLYSTLSGLPCRIELWLLDFLTFQLDRELISHNVIVSTLEEKMSEVFLESADKLEAIKELRNDKMALKVRLLGQLEKLKKALNDISRLQERVTSDDSEIASLRAQIDRECAEKLELKHKIHKLEKDLKCCEGDIKELRADAEHQCDRYNEI